MRLWNVSIAYTLLEIMPGKYKYWSALQETKGTVNYAAIQDAAMQHIKHGSRHPYHLQRSKCMHSLPFDGMNM